MKQQIEETNKNDGGIDLSKCDLGNWKLLGIAAAALGGGLAGCGPARVDKWVDVDPNKTAFKIEVEGDKQIQFESEKFLTDRKVAAKRVYINQKQVSTGRMWFDYQYIETTKVITVDRGLVTREWTSDNDSGTNKKNEALIVTTKDGGSIYFGINLTARIDEPLAARYLYFHGQRPLSDVIDTNIRSDIQGILSKIAGGMDRSDVQGNLPQIFQQLEPQVKALAEARGITIDNIGPAEGIKYVNPQIQAAIDQQILAEASKKTATEKQAAASIENTTAIQKAQADAKQSQILSQNMASLQKKQELDINMKKADAMLKLAEKWDGKLPENIMPANSPFLNQLGLTAPGGGK